VVRASTGRWLALLAAFLGWLFDGFEMGIFGVVGKDALKSMLGSNNQGDVDVWFGIVVALFLVGAAAGGVLFGWLGDRVGRVRAMSLSILTYALCTGGCGLAQTPLQLALLRFLAALGMGGEWALGVALVMEVWPQGAGSFLKGVSVRAWLAGTIGAAANLGFALVALLSVGLSSVLQELREFLEWCQLPSALTEELLANRGWRLLMLLGITPAILTFFLRLWVPESAKWHEERDQGRTAHWATRDLTGVLVGTLAAMGIAFLWIPGIELHYGWRILGMLAGLIIAALGYLYPVRQYMRRAQTPVVQQRFLIRRMALAAVLSGIPLLGTWASIQWAPSWVRTTLAPLDPAAPGWTQFWSAMGASFGTVIAAWLGDWMGRRSAYVLLCVMAFGSVWGFYLLNNQYGFALLAWVFVAGFWVGSFYGWIPLYFPELFPTAVRAIGQGFGYNFGRILAAVGALQTGVLTTAFSGNIATAAAWMACLYLVGILAIYFAPETKGRGLPD
jgi:MFS transporter, SHS family, sialic acid transporter